MVKILSFCTMEEIVYVIEADIAEQNKKMYHFFRYYTNTM